MHLDHPLLLIRIVDLPVLRVKRLHGRSELLGLSVALGGSGSTAVSSGEGLALLVCLLIIIKV